MLLCVFRGSLTYLVLLFLELVGNTYTNLLSLWLIVFLWFNIILNKAAIAALADFKNPYPNAGTDLAVVSATTGGTEGQVLVTGDDVTKTVTIATCTEKGACATETVTNTVEVE
jgi:hypothetical protein